MFVPGLTAALLLRSAGDPGPGAVVAVFGATGAVGSVLLQLLRVRGIGTRIATASGARRGGAARRYGATAVVDPEPAGPADALRAAGRTAVNIVFDPVGGPTTTAALDALGPCGRIIVFGSASGRSAGVDPRSLIIGSRCVVGFWLMDHLTDGGRVHAELDRLMEMVVRADISIATPRIFALSDVGTALQATRCRGGTGRVLLDPWSDR